MCSLSGLPSKTPAGPRSALTTPVRAGGLVGANHGSARLNKQNLSCDLSTQLPAHFTPRRPIFAIDSVLYCIVLLLTTTKEPAKAIPNGSSRNTGQRAPQRLLGQRLVSQPTDSSICLFPSSIISSVPSHIPLIHGQASRRTTSHSRLSDMSPAAPSTYTTELAQSCFLPNLRFSMQNQMRSTHTLRNDSSKKY